LFSKPVEQLFRTFGQVDGSVSHTDKGGMRSLPMPLGWYGTSHPFEQLQSMFLLLVIE
jgi:hypothetical protein